MSGERILLVEGEDDEKVVEHLCRVCGVPRNFTIENERGFPKLRGNVSAWAKQPGLHTLGILADANDDPRERWRQIADAFPQEGREAVCLPDVPAPSGTIVEGSLRVGVWLMPDNQRPGELEDFAHKLVPSSDRVWPLAASYIESIPEKDRGFKPGKILRAKLYAWLASRELPQRMGVAIAAGDLDAQAPLAKQFAKWLADLFGE